MEIIAYIAIVILLLFFIFPTNKETKPRPWIYKEGEKVPPREKTLKNYLDQIPSKDEKRLRRIK
jgi:hypothetical protein